MTIHIPDYFSSEIKDARKPLQLCVTGYKLVVGMAQTILFQIGLNNDRINMKYSDLSYISAMVKMTRR